MKLAHFFYDVDMRCSHDGLWEIVKKHRIKIGSDDFVLFFNAKKNICKAFCGTKEVLLSYKKDNRIIDPGVIPYLPKYCGGGAMQMDAAKREFLLDLLARKKGVKKAED